ncbi:hypothetical protein [[Kitasatospora] papulosa]|uniref:hypothetical protein n=1 Tax=[Kitasatospora] papulosa TaxID=1464011 RepID=UPI00368453CA
MDGADFGGMKEQGEKERAQTPAHWLPYFTVSDTERTAAPAPPSHIPGDGPWVATLRDPRGAGFGIHTP